VLDSIDNTYIYKEDKNRCLGARKHTCDVDMRRAYAIEVLNCIQDTLKVHMYWLHVQVLSVEAFVVCRVLFVAQCVLTIAFF